MENAEYFLMAFFRYIMLLSAPLWVHIVSGIVVVIAFIYAIYRAISDHNFLGFLAPVVFWAVVVIFYFFYDKLNLIIIPF